MMSNGGPDSSELSPIALLLIPKDYPKSYRGLVPGTKKFAHAEDYRNDSCPVKPEAFLYKSGDGHNRILVRLSFRITPDGCPDVRYTSATFILDTGCCHDLEVCDELSALLTHRWRKDSIVDYVKVQIEDEVHICHIKSDLPPSHQPTNVMGLPFFFALGIQFRAARFYNLIGDDVGIIRDVVTWTKKVTHL
jgi:hypothetical protein